MSKSKKKKKNLDFQKVKLKVGRKIKRDNNETKAEFKTRKIVLKEVRSFRDDPLTALVRHSDRISHQGKLSMLSHFNSALTPDVTTSLTKPILDGLAKFVVDDSSKIRDATYKCLKTCLNHLKRNQMPMVDFIKSIQPYLDCAYTHVSKPINMNCHSFIEHLLNVNEPQTFETLMSILLRRYEAGNLSTKELDLAIRLKQQYLRYRQKQKVEEMLSSDKVESLVWPQVLDLNRHLHFQKDEDREILLVSNRKDENVSKRYLETIVESTGNSTDSHDSPFSSRPIKRVRIT